MNGATWVARRGAQTSLCTGIVLERSEWHRQGTGGAPTGDGATGMVHYDLLQFSSKLPPSSLFTVEPLQRIPASRRA